MVWNMWFLRGNRARSYTVKSLSARLWRDFAAEFFIFAAECHPKVRICVICVRIYALCMAYRCYLRAPSRRALGRAGAGFIVRRCGP